jgi:hypothetical protein
MIYPYYIFLSGFLYPEGLVLVLFVILMYFTLNYVSTKRNIDYFKVVFILFLLYFCKVTSLSLLPILCIPFVSLGVSKRAFVLFSLGISMFLILNIPWMIRNYIAYQEVTVLTRHGDVDLIENKEFSSDNNESIFIKTLNSLKFIPKNSVDYFNPGISNVKTDTHLTNWKYKLISYIAVIPLLASLLAILFRRDQKTIILYVVYLLYALPFLLLFGQTRYRLPSDFILMIFLIMIIEGVFLESFDKNLRFSRLFPVLRR